MSRSPLAELIEELKKKIEAEEEKLNGMPEDGELALCLGYCEGNGGMAIVVKRRGVFLEDAKGKSIPLEETELEKYKGVIMKTIKLAEKEKKPLSTKYHAEIYLSNV